MYVCEIQLNKLLWYDTKKKNSVENDEMATQFAD